MVSEMITTLYDAINGENTAIALFFIGVYGLVARRNVIKSIMSLSVMQAAIVLFFVSMHATETSPPPIGIVFSQPPADPVPHALMITAIVIGISVTAVSLTMFITLYHKYGSTNWNKVRRKRGEMG
jgi:multicomponent Na+:H+ antiporter subunit C